MLASQNIQDEPFRITSDDAIIGMEEDITLELYNIPSLVTLRIVHGNIPENPIVLEEHIK